MDVPSLHMNESKRSQPKKILPSNKNINLRTFAQVLIRLRFRLSTTRLCILLFNSATFTLGALPRNSKKFGSQFELSELFSTRPDKTYDKNPYKWFTFWVLTNVWLRLYSSPFFYSQSVTQLFFLWLLYNGEWTQSFPKATIYLPYNIKYL